MELEIQIYVGLQTVKKNGLVCESIEIHAYPNQFRAAQLDGPASPISVTLFTFPWSHFRSPHRNTRLLCCRMNVMPYPPHKQACCYSLHPSFLSLLNLSYYVVLVTQIGRFFVLCYHCSSFAPTSEILRYCLSRSPLHQTSFSDS